MDHQLLIGFLIAVVVAILLFFLLGKKDKSNGDDNSVPVFVPTPTDLADSNGWEIGPIILGRNYSVNMPLHPVKGLGGLAINIPFPSADQGHVHYVTFPYGSLAGKKRLTLRYRVDMAEGVRLAPVTGELGPSILSLYFQRAGDNWSAQGIFEAYRWYSSFENHMPIVAGEHILAADLDANWTAVLTSSAQNNPTAYMEALANAERVGFVLGGGTGLGHGVFATGPATLTFSFEVE